MAFGRILAPVTGAKRDVAVLKTAIEAARPFNAHVVALFVRPDPRLSVPYMGTPISPTIVQDIVDAVNKVTRETEQHALATLKSVAAAEGIAIVTHPKKTGAVTCSFRSIDGLVPIAVGDAATLADLVVFGPLAPGDGVDIAESFLQTLTTADRPVLVCPDAPVQLGRRVAVGWDGSRSAAHAVSAALPFLVRAEKVEIISVDRGPRSRVFADIDEYLALHGVTATHRTVEHGPSGIAESLMDAAAQGGADLLVMGGYGHGYWRETLFGGVTSHVRWHAHIPILMVH